MITFYSIEDILNIAHIHPFYTSSVAYPPDPDEIALALKGKDGRSSALLSTQPLLSKEKLYKRVERLYADVNPENTYRRSSYISTTGGGSGKSLPMVFLTDSQENRNQRSWMSLLMKACGAVVPSDWVLDLSSSGYLYRAMDLCTQLIELAGGNVLSAGHLMPYEKCIAACIKYGINAVSGDSSHILNFANHVAALPQGERCNIKIAKILYTSELMTRSKRQYLTSVFGQVSFFSLFASAETGPWAVADLNNNATANPDDDSTTEYLYDTRAMKIEILSPESGAWSSASDSPPAESDFENDGTTGHLVLTSLQRLKNPLVRYVSGDVGSVYPLAESSYTHIDPEMRRNLKALRLHGRDKRFSFKWLGEYFEYDKLDQVMQSPEWGILQWQIILEHGREWDHTETLELRLMRRLEDEKTLGKENLLRCVRDTFFVTDLNETLFRPVILDSLAGFERSESSGKVIGFIDKRH